MLPFACLFLLSACGVSPRFELEDTAKEKLADMRINFRLEFSEGRKLWFYSLENGKLIPKGVQSIPPAGLEARPHILFEKDVPDNVPSPIEGHEYYGRYEVSPDRSLAIFSISRTDQQLPYAADFVLMEWKKKKIIYYKSNYFVPHRDIEDVAWSPNSERFVLLERYSKRRYGFVDIISLILAHPCDYATFFLAIYNRNGELLTRFKVASDLGNGEGRVFWQKHPESRKKETTLEVVS